jgi:quercetin dioxygenase-like cupin family protein
MPKSVKFDDVEWEAPTRGYYLTDVKQKTLWVDEGTGATLALVKFPPGVADRLHTHPKANQIIYGLSGEINTPSGRVVVEGSSVNVTPRGEVHGRGDFLKESIVLFYWDGPPDSELAE